MGTLFLAWATPCPALREGCPGLSCKAEGDFPDYYDYPPMRWFTERGQPLTKEMLSFYSNQLYSEGRLELTYEEQEAWNDLMASMDRVWKLLEPLAFSEAFHTKRSSHLLEVLSPDPKRDDEYRRLAPWTKPWHQWQVLLAKN